MRKQVQIAVILALFLGCQQGESPPEPGAGPPEGYVAKAELDALHVRYEKLLKELQDRRIENDTKFLERENELLTAELRDAKKAIGNLTRANKAAAGKSLGFSLADHQAELLREGNWTLLSFDKREGGQVMHQAMHQKMRLHMVMAGGSPDALTALTVSTAFGESDSQSSRELRVNEICRTLSAHSPYSSDEVLHWLGTSLKDIAESEGNVGVIRNGVSLWGNMIPTDEGGLLLIGISSNRNEEAQSVPWSRWVKQHPMKK